MNAAVSVHGGEADFVIRRMPMPAIRTEYCQRLMATRPRAARIRSFSMHTQKGEAAFQRAAAAAQNPLLGNGGSAHPQCHERPWVDHAHALMTLDAYRAVEGYDESFTHKRGCGARHQAQ